MVERFSLLFSFLSCSTFLVSLLFSLPAIERAILPTTAHLLLSVDGSPPSSSPLDESPPKSSPLYGSPPEASLCDSKVKGYVLLGEVRFDHQDCISKEIKEKQPFPPQFK
ncbi:unnamed protein product, partial [Brassica rapa subsp. narinosa]